MTGSGATPRWWQRRALTRAALVLVWGAGSLLLLSALAYSGSHRVLGLDSHAYWLSGHRWPLYDKAPGADDAYLYSPAFATLVWPLTRLPALAFEYLWMSVEAVAFAWLLKPLGWKWGLPLFLVCLVEAMEGDIYALMGVAAVVGLRHGSSWALLLLTKIAPGLGVVWFAVRREWRRLAWALLVPAAIALVSMVLWPTAWWDWLRFLRNHRSGGSALFPVRFGVALALTGYAARTNRPWLLAPAMMLAMPRAGNLPTYTMLAAIPRLRHATAVRAGSAAPRRHPVTPVEGGWATTSPPVPMRTVSTARET